MPWARAENPPAETLLPWKSVLIWMIFDFAFATRSPKSFRYAASVDTNCECCSSRLWTPNLSAIVCGRSMKSKVRAGEGAGPTPILITASKLRLEMPTRASLALPAWAHSRFVPGQPGRGNGTDQEFATLH